METAAANRGYSKADVTAAFDVVGIRGSRHRLTEDTVKLMSLLPLMLSASAVQSADKSKVL